MKLKNAHTLRHAIYARNELLMLWLVILPWRQKNLREMRVTGTNPNLFFPNSVLFHSHQAELDCRTRGTCAEFVLLADSVLTR